MGVLLKNLCFGLVWSAAMGIGLANAQSIPSEKDNLNGKLGKLECEGREIARMNGLGEWVCSDSMVETERQVESNFFIMQQNLRDINTVRSSLRDARTRLGVLEDQDLDSRVGALESQSGAFRCTIVAGPVGGTDTLANGNALRDAVSNAPDTSTCPRLAVHVEPGTYDLGSGMGFGRPTVLSGAGQNLTTLQGTVGFSSDSEVRNLTIESPDDFVVGSVLEASSRIIVENVTVVDRGRFGVFETKYILALNFPFREATLRDVTLIIDERISDATTVVSIDGGSGGRKVFIENLRHEGYGVWEIESAEVTIRNSEIEAGISAIGSTSLRVWNSRFVFAPSILNSINLSGSSSLQAHGSQLDRGVGTERFSSATAVCISTVNESFELLEQDTCMPPF